MDEDKLRRRLNSVGKTVFVECFSIFKSYANKHISKEDCIEKLMQKYPGKKESGCDICCGNARLIFLSNTEYKALSIICENWMKSRLSNKTIEQAKALLQDCPNNSSQPTANTPTILSR